MTLPADDPQIITSPPSPGDPGSASRERKGLLYIRVRVPRSDLIRQKDHRPGPNVRPRQTTEYSP